MQHKPHSNLDHEEYPEPVGELLPEMKHYGRTREEQIRINQEGIEMMRKWREKATQRQENLTPEEKQKELEAWKMVEETIDTYRNRKLFDQK
ncbi:hypothetical protein [Cyanothece sp. BG0011]|uniref:hypothetical protein n=1 Tax=Cyanothece sp. BG0011 TaxID=2082950 RepID=UPI000D1F6A03|nr:hypothetical protein [Cyanothece sp. BG0011]